MGIGRFFTPGELEKTPVLSTTELFYGIPRLQVVEDPCTNRELLCGGLRLMIETPTGSCGAPIWVDGVLMSTDGRGLEMIAPLRTISAIEVYAGAAQLPLQWSGSLTASAAISRPPLGSQEE